MHQSLVQYFLHSVLSHYSSILLSNCYGTGFMSRALSSLLCYVITAFSVIAGADLGGGGHGGPMPPPSGLSPRETRRFATRLAHVATLMQCTSLYESLLHVLHT